MPQEAAPQTELTLPRRAMYAGSFDPPTIGHEWVISQGAELFDELHVAVGVNPAKKTWFTPQERIEMLQDIATPYPNVTVGEFGMRYQVDYARQNGFGFLLRGLRSSDDFKAESTLLSLNRERHPGVRAVFVICPDDLAKVSSSAVKGLVGYEDWEEFTSTFVSDLVLAGLKRVHESPIAKP